MKPEDIQLIYNAFCKATKSGCYIPAEVCKIEETFKKLAAYCIHCDESHVCPMNDCKACDIKK